MRHKTIKISEELHKEIKQFCEENNHKLNQWCEDQLHSQLLYGKEYARLDKVPKGCGRCENLEKKGN
jgi:hypothetical protein